MSDLSPSVARALAKKPALAPVALSVASSVSNASDTTPNQPHPFSAEVLDAATTNGDAYFPGALDGALGELDLLEAEAARYRLAIGREARFVKAPERRTVIFDGPLFTWVCEEAARRREPFTVTARFLIRAGRALVEARAAQREARAVAHGTVFAEVPPKRPQPQPSVVVPIETPAPAPPMPTRAPQKWY